MVREFQAVLDGLPDKPAASLEEYRELIGELRRRGLTYREIAGVLAENFQVKADLGVIHDVLRGSIKRRKPLPRRPRPKTEAAPAPAPAPPDVQVVRQVVRMIPLPKPKSRLEAGKPVFEYDENQPLRLIGDSKSIE